MVIRGIAAFAVLTGLALPAWAAGPFEGEWEGEIVAKPGEERKCGFKSNQARAIVTGSRAEISAKDAEGSETTIKTNVSPEGAVVANVDRWKVVSMGYASWGDARGNLKGQFSPTEFRGTLDAMGGGASSCSAEIRLHRPGQSPSRAVAAPPLVAGSLDGEWEGEIVAKPGEQRVCGFKSGPARAKVTGGRAEIVAKDARGAEQTAAANISSDGRLSTYVNPWAVMSSQNSTVVDTSGSLKGEFFPTEFRGTLDAMSTAGASVSSCSAEIRLYRPGQAPLPAAAPAVAALPAPRPGSAPIQPAASAVSQSPADTVRTTATASAPAAASGNIANQLATLRQLLDSALIDAKEFETRKAALLDKTFGAALPPKEPAPPAAPPPAMTAEASAWEAIKGSANASDFDAYLAKYPSGPRAAAAAARRDELKLAAEAAAWERIKDSRSPAPFKDFLARFPSGRYAAPAAVRLEAATVFNQIKGFDFGRYHALVIGNNSYRDLPKLRTAATDAKALSDALTKEYGFTVRTIIDGTRAHIVEALDSYRETLRERDNLLIYYAGHGWLDEDAGRGYWLPVDAQKNRRTNWIENTTVADTLKTLRAKHVIVIADSCYSGTLMRDTNITLRTVDYWQQMAEKRTRVAMTSGGLEPVADGAGGIHSPFAKAMIEALAGNESVMDGTQLFAAVRRPVMLNAKQTPQYADVREAGHEGGDFLFVRRR